MVQRTARHYCWRRCFKHTRLAQRDNIFSYLQQTSLSETQLLIDYLNEGQADRYAYASNVSEAMDKFDMDIPNTWAFHYERSSCNSEPIPLGNLLALSSCRRASVTVR